MSRRDPGYGFRDYHQGSRLSKPLRWPWEAEAFKPTPDDRVRELVKAGALIAAEIDRLGRAASAPEREGKR